MPILKNMQKPNGALVTFHKPVSAQVDFTQGIAMVNIAAWPNEEANTNGLPLDWMWPPMSVPLSRLADLEDALLELEGSPFLGGSRVLDQAGGLEGVKARKWAEIKAMRSAMEFGGFTWDGSAFDSDPVSTSRIEGACTLALIAQLQATEFTEDWTLADNTSRLLSTTEVLQVGVALGQHVSAVHAQAKALRDQIEAAASAEALAEIVWPA